MPVRSNRITDASRRGRKQVEAVIADGRSARLAAGLSHRAVAEVIGCSRQLIGALERGEIQDVSVDLLVRYAAAVGLDATIRTFAGGSPIRDIGHVRLTERFLATVGGEWQVRSEVAVSADPLDRRAFDVLLRATTGRVGVEAVTRLTDSQGQGRSALLKQEAAGIDAMILVVADTRHNREALRAGAATLRASFPLGTHEVLEALRSGRVPEANGIVVV